MALYFTFAIECHRQDDARRIGERLRALVLTVGGRPVPMAQVEVFAHGELWYVFANPQGPGYSQFGYGDGLNEPSTIAAITEGLYSTIAAERGVRRALSGYEAQDIFDLFGEPELVRFDTPDLVYDRAAAVPTRDAEQFGPYYFRNRGRQKPPNQPPEPTR